MRPGMMHENGSKDFPFQLGQQGVHEVCETAFGDLGALTGFVLSATPRKTGVIVWVSQGTLHLNHGRPFEGGLNSIRRQQFSLLHAIAHKQTDTLWIIEEVIRSKAASLVIAELSDMDFTASRRLVLASERHNVPAVLLMPYNRTGATAASARWRVAPQPSAPNHYDKKAPGHARWQAMLERSRQAPQVIGQRFDLEFNDETLSLHMVSRLASHTAQADTRYAEAVPSIRKYA